MQVSISWKFIWTISALYASCCTIDLFFLWLESKIEMTAARRAERARKRKTIVGSALGRDTHTD